MPTTPVLTVLYDGPLIDPAGYWGDGSDATYYDVLTDDLNFYATATIPAMTVPVDAIYLDQIITVRGYFHIQDYTGTLGSAPHGPWLPPGTNRLSTLMDISDTVTHTLPGLSTFASSLFDAAGPTTYVGHPPVWFIDTPIRAALTHGLTIDVATTQQLLQLGRAWAGENWLNYGRITEASMKLTAISYVTTPGPVWAPLRGRQRGSGATSAVPMRGRNTAPYGLRGRQESNR